MDIDATRLISEVNAMRNDIKDGKHEEKYFKEKYDYIYNISPNLFELVKENKINCIPMLQYMLKKHESMKQGKISKEEADKIVGFKLYDKYEMPKLTVEQKQGYRELKKQHGIFE